MEIKLKTLTPLWTGGVDQTCDRLHETGLIGSLRWWYEALVRGLGGYACDPTSEDRCPDQDGKHCVACELFGYTGWARKFRLQVLSAPDFVSFGNLKAVKAEQAIDIQFTPLRPITEEEWCLLQLALRLIAVCGAMGGKTVFKPLDETGRDDQFHHRDFGLIDVEFSEGWPAATSLGELRNFVQAEKWRKGSHKYGDGEHDYSWASLQNFWCVKGRYLARQSTKKSTFNLIVGRKQDKSKKERRGKRIIRWSDFLEDRDDTVSRWLAGDVQESKKIFSFKEPPRTFGFVNPGQIGFEEIKNRLRKAWPDLRDDEFLIGEQILDALCAPQGGNR